MTVAIMELYAALKAVGASELQARQAAEAVAAGAKSDEAWRGNVDAWRGNVDTWRRSVDAWRGNVDGWRRSVDAWRGDVDGWRRSVDLRLANLEARIARLEWMVKTTLAGIAAILIGVATLIAKAFLAS